MFHLTMAKNINSAQAGMLQHNAVSDPSVHVSRGKNEFPQSFQHPSSTSYGLVDPVIAAKCEPGDEYPYKFVTDLNTFTMKSPMKSQVKMYSAAFKVPMKAIYPNNWDIMFPHPNKGDDVPMQEDPSSNVRAIFPSRYFLDSLISDLGSYSQLPSFFISDYIRLIFVLEAVLSDGSLFSKFNMHFCNLRLVGSNSQSYVCFDDWFDLVFVPWLRDRVFVPSTSASDTPHLVYHDHSEGYPAYNVTSDPVLVGTRFSWSEGYGFYVSLERAIELVRTGEWFVLPGITVEDLDSQIPSFLLADDQFIPEFVNIESICSYQLACSHFFNNPKIDYIYDCKLWLANLLTLFTLGTGTNPYWFSYNGLHKFYDVFSARYFFDAADLSIWSFASDFCSYWLSLFGFHRSLRYGDYFTGSKPEPIAPGDIDVEPQSDGSINSLDIVRRLQLTRYLNKVNISGPRSDDYLQAIFGQSLPEAPDDVPIRLSKEAFDVSGFEVNNTGSDQLSDSSPNITTTNLRLSESRNMFMLSVSDPCWFVVVQYFDAHRIYSKTFDRMAFHFDRYDDFLPDLQFIGDQDIMAQELLGTETLGDDAVPFAYTLRYMEYKQRTSYASGAFIRRLKSWAFITDNNDGASAMSHITPEYIRSSPTEFDRFYKSLTGWSLGTRYHFITFTTNVAAPRRQMVYAPEILA